MTADKKVGQQNIREILHSASSKLKDAGSVSAEHEAEMLLCFVLGCSRTELFLRQDIPLSAQQAESYGTCLRKRIQKTPLQQITGEQHFRHIVLKMRPGVFIPRPETELLAGMVVEWIAQKESPLVIDIGTGSGAIALSVAQEAPRARIIAIDICPDALALAAENAAALGVRDRVDFVQGSLFSGVAEIGRGCADVIVSNPPYILSSEIEGLPSEVKDFDPIAALDGGKDGLSIIRDIVKGACDFLMPGGLLAIEIGLGQAHAVRQIIEDTEEFEKPRVGLDYAGIERIVSAVRLRK